MPSASNKLAQVGVIILMVLASAMLVGNVPIWIWIGSQVADTQQAGFGPYVLVAGGILCSVTLLVFALSRLNRSYERLVGERRMVRVRMPWMRSMRDDASKRAGTELTVLDTVLIATALATFAGFGFWFFFLAGSPLPNA